MNGRESYTAKLNAMAKIFEQWKAENKTAVIQFNYPRHVAVAATIGVAISMHFITADQDGMELLKRFGLGTSNEPTVMQVRAVLGTL